MADLSPALLALGGVMAGGLISAGSTLFLGRMQHGHEMHRAEIEREARRVEARDTYQVETLLELQLALQRLVRACGAANHQDVMHHRRTGDPFGRQPLGGAVNREMFEAAVAVRILASRVALDGPREAALTAHHESSLVGLLRDEGAANAKLLEIVDLFNQAQEEISKALRLLPAPSSYRPLITSPIAPEDL